MQVTVQLFGSFSDYSQDRELQVEVADQASVGDLRVAVGEHLGSTWPQFNPALLRYSAFADSERVLREHEPLPADGRVSILPPVSGG